MLQTLSIITLKPPQSLQFRRSIIYRGAGLAIPIMRKTESEGSAQIQTRLQPERWQDRQASLFARADEEIQRLRNTFPDDLFFTPKPFGVSRFKMFAVTSRH